MVRVDYIVVWAAIVISLILLALLTMFLLADLLITIETYLDHYLIDIYRFIRQTTMPIMHTKKATHTLVPPVCITIILIASE